MLNPVNFKTRGQAKNYVKARVTDPLNKQITPALMRDVLTFLIDNFFNLADDADLLEAPFWGDLLRAKNDPQKINEYIEAFVSGALAAALVGKADLVGGHVPAAQLPSYVDDVIEADSINDLPAVGERGKIYIIAAGPDKDKQYRWAGSSYAQLITGGDVSLAQEPSGNSDKMALSVKGLNGNFVSSKSPQAVDGAKTFNAPLKVLGNTDESAIGPIVGAATNPRGIGVALTLDASACPGGVSYSFISTGPGATGGAGDFAVYAQPGGYVFRVIQGGGAQAAVYFKAPLIEATNVARAPFFEGDGSRLTNLPKDSTKADLVNSIVPTYQLPARAIGNIDYRNRYVASGGTLIIHSGDYWHVGGDVTLNLTEIPFGETFFLRISSFASNLAWTKLKATDGRIIGAYPQGTAIHFRRNGTDVIDLGVVTIGSEYPSYANAFVPTDIKASVIAGDYDSKNRLIATPAGSVGTMQFATDDYLYFCFLDSQITSGVLVYYWYRVPRQPQPASQLVLVSPNGTKFALTVNDSGNLTTSQV